MLNAPIEEDAPQKPHFSFLALKGGGSRGPIHIGIMMLLEKLGLLSSIAMVGGTSAGGIGALLISSGWSSDKIREELAALDLYDLIYQEYTVTALYRLYMGLGLHSGQKIYEWFQDIIEQITGDENTTFLEWHQLVVDKTIVEKEDKKKKKDVKYPMKDICLEAHNTSTGFNEVFSHISQHKDVPIADALRATMAYTGFFTPWEIKGHLYADGGLQADCPVKLFEAIDGAPNPKMLAVWLDEPERLNYFQNKTPLKPSVPKNLTEFIYANILGMYNVQLRALAHSPYKDKFMLCDTVGIDTFDFSNTTDNQEKLIQSGFYGGLRYFLLNYPEFTKQFFSPALIAHIEALEHPIAISQFEETPMLVSFASLKLDSDDEREDDDILSIDDEEKWAIISPLFDAMKVSSSVSGSSSEASSSNSSNVPEKKSSWWRLFGY